MNDKRQSFEDIGFGYRPRAVYACDPARSRGRLYNEAESPTRTPFQRDRDRIIHSTAFRRLKHKTQVFIAHEGDHYRTRLTHTIEVAQIARAIARALRLDEDLAEAVALVHDFGHPPFGHTGEEALDAKMAPWGGFDHNAQSLKVVTDLERRYAEFDGLNLSWETLEGLVKHNGPLTDAAGKSLAGDLPEVIANYCRGHDLELAKFASLEAQAAAIADDIAYDAHDIDDGLRSGLLTLEMLAETPIAGELLAEVRAKYPHLDATRIGHEVVRRQITMMVEDVISNSKLLIALLQPSSSDAVRAAGRACVAFSQEVKKSEASLKSYLYGHLYRHPKVMEIRGRAEIIIDDLFDRYMDDPASMPRGWREGLEHRNKATRARVVADFLAGMTDTYAIKEHQRLFDHTPELG